MIKPNFFIIGAGKCGTTSLATYLSEHPKICISNPKEPFFFATDFNHGIRKLDLYLKCFSHATEKHLAIGEASTNYLVSEVAVSNILSFNPDAKFIVMIRNPIDMANSMHSELYFNGLENIKDFQTAWNLQEQRKLGFSIPTLCYVPKVLQYRNLCLLGDQLERLFSNVSRQRILIIINDDMKKNPKEVYENVLAFLNVPSDERNYFPVLNQNKQASTRWIIVLLKIIEITKEKLLGARPLRTGLLSKLAKLNTINKQRSPLPVEFRQELIKSFQEDVEKLSKLLDRDLTHWLNN